MIQNTYIEIGQNVAVFDALYTPIETKSIFGLKCPECDLAQKAKVCDMVECRIEYRQDKKQVVFKMV